MSNMYKEKFIKIRCNNCMSYFDYTEAFFECPICKTSAYLMDMTKDDIENKINITNEGNKNV